MLSRRSLPPWLRRPIALTGLSLVAVAALLSGGLVVAHAVDGTPAADTTPADTTGSAGGNGGDNVAAGVNTQDGRTVYAIKLKLVQTASDTVDATNAAAAVNSGCTDCSTVAVAFEGVLVAGSPSTFDPTNLALAYNQDCSGCTAFADAYQQVVQSSTRVRITGSGRRQVATIRTDLESLRHEDLTLDAIVARVIADEQAFADVLRNEVVPVGHVTDATPAGGQDISDNPDATAGPTAAPAETAAPPTSDSSAAPSAGAPSPDATASSPEATPSATPSS